MDKSKRNTFISILYSVAIIFFETCYLLPSVKIFLDITKISVISFVFVVLFFSDTLKYKIITKTFLIALPFLMLHFVVGYQLDFWNGFLHPLLLLWFTLFPAFLCYEVMSRGTKIEIITGTLFFLAIFLYVGFNTLGQLQYDEDVLRVLTSGALGEDYAFEMAINNNGGFGFVYAAGVVFVAVFAILINVAKMKIWLRVTLITISVFLFMIIRDAQFTTLLLLVIGISYFVVLFRVNKNTRRILLWLSPLIVIGVPLLLDLFISFYEGSVTGDHLQDLSNSIYGGGDSGGSATGRSRLFINAFLASLSSPLWGQSVIGTAAGKAAHSCHSVILTNLVETGMIGVFFKYRAILFSANSVMKKIDHSLCHKILYPTIMYFLLLSLLNPIEQIGDINMSVFFCIPLLLSFIAQETSKDELYK